MQKRKRSFSTVMLVFAVVMLLALLCGCNYSGPVVGDTSTVIRISMYNDVSYSAWRTYVEDQCPDITIIWENNRNVTDNLVYQAEHNDMADIVTIRKFTSDGARRLSPYLSDLSDYDIASTFTEGALDLFKTDGKTLWFPAPGMTEVFLANKTLFDKYGIKIPETFGELTDACSLFEKKGIDGIAFDASMGFSTTMLVESFGYYPFFSTDAGQKWISDFSNGIIDDSAGLGNVADSLRRLVLCGALDSGDLKYDSAARNEVFDADKAAIRSAGSDLPVPNRQNAEYVALPILGATADQSYLYTYPVFNVGISKTSALGSEKKAAIEKVLDVMFSKGAQEALASDTGALVSYNKGIDLPVADAFGNIRDLFINKKCFIRFLNTNTFNSTTAAVDAIVNGQASDSDFRKILVSGLKAPADNSIVGKSDIYASNILNSSLVRPAASVIAQSVLGSTSADIVIIDSKCAAAPIYKCEYTSAMLDAITWDVDLYRAKLTGAELKRVFYDAMLATTTYKFNALEPLLDYPAIAGMSAELYKNDISGRLMLKNGSDIKDGDSYNVVITATVYNALDHVGYDGLSSFLPIGKSTRDVLAAQLATGSLPRPQEYFSIEGSGK